MKGLLEGSFQPAVGRGGATLAVPRGKPHRLGMPQRALGGMATTMSEMLGPREMHAFGILTYHRVTEPIPCRAEPTWNVPPELFQQQLEGLCARGFRAWPLARVLTHVREGRPIPPKVFVITFDDAYENVYLNAFPVLRLLRLPATVFLATAYLDSPDPLPSDDWAEAGSGNVPYTAWRPLSTEECTEMQRSGLVELGAHTHIHAGYLRGTSELIDEARRSQRVLRERFHVEQASFAYSGVESDDAGSGELSAALKGAGLSCALTSEPRLVRAGDDLFAWGRFTAEVHDTAASLAAKLSGWYDAFRSLGRVLLCGSPRPCVQSPPARSDAETECA